MNMEAEGGEAREYERRGGLIEAMRWRGREDDEALRRWVGGAAEIVNGADGSVYLRSAMGLARIEAGDYIAREGALHFVWRPHIFACGFRERRESRVEMARGASTW